MESKGGQTKTKIRQKFDFQGTIENDAKMAHPREFFEVIFDSWLKTRKSLEKTPPANHPEIDAEKIRKNIGKTS